MLRRIGRVLNLFARRRLFGVMVGLMMTCRLCRLNFRVRVVMDSTRKVRLSRVDSCCYRIVCSNFIIRLADLCSRLRVIVR